MSSELSARQSSPYTVDIAETESLSEGVVRALATISGLDPVPGTEGRPSLDPLYTAIDPEALDSLFRSGTTGTVQFTYHGFEVTASSEGRLVVRNPETDG